MPYLTNLAAVARRTGFPVVEQPGWRTRGHGPMSAVRSVIAHHDAANHRPNQFNTVIQNGHSTLPGPLAHFALRRDGTIHVVAAGLCYHAGSNINPSLYNNSYSIGIEAGNNGVGEPWPEVQLRAYRALCAELCKEFGLPVSRVMGHKEIAPARKIDPAGISMPTFRAQVSQLMKSGGPSKPPAASKPKTSAALIEEASMFEKLPAGGKIVPGGASSLRYDTIEVPSVLREHDLKITPVYGPDAGVHIKSINTWKHITKDQAQARWGASTSRPGGVGALIKNAWVHKHTSLSMRVPKGVARLDIAYASNTPVKVSVTPREV